MQARTGCILKSDVYCPILEVSSFLHEESLLELYYALRGAVLNQRPLILPILDGQLMLLASALLNREKGAPLACQAQDASLNNWLSVVDRHPYAARAVLETIPWLCQTCCTLSTDSSGEEIAVKLVNFCQELKLLERSDGLAPRVAEIYESQFRSLASAKRPNTAVVRVLRGLSSRSEAIGIRVLNFRNFLMGNVGCIALSSVLRLLPSVEELDLSGNGIECSGVHALCKNLVAHPSVSTMDLSDNLIAVAGFSDLYFLALDNGRIKSVSLEKNASASAVWTARLGKVLSRNAAGRTEPLPLDIDQKYAEVRLLLRVLGNQCGVSVALSSNQGNFELPWSPFEPTEAVPKMALEKFVYNFVPCNLLTITRIDSSTIKIIVDNSFSEDWLLATSEDAKGLPSPGLTTTVLLVMTALTRREDAFALLLRSLVEQRCCLSCRVKVSCQYDAPDVDFFNKSRFIEASLSLTLPSLKSTAQCSAASLVQVYKEQLDECRGSLSKELEILLHRLHRIDGEGSSSVEAQLQDHIAVELAEAQEEDEKKKGEILSQWTR
jgi:hypothetical protein